MSKRGPRVEFDDVVGVVYDAALDPARWPDALTAISRLLDTGQTGFMEHDFRNGQARVLSVSLPRPDEQTLDALAYYSPQNPFMPAAAEQLRTGSVLFSGAFVPDRELFKTAYWNEYMLKITGFHHNVGICLERTDSSATMVYPLREVGHRPFSDRELATCRRLVPHLQRALEVGRRLAQSDLARLAASDALDRLHTAICVLDARGKLVLANRQAVEILDERDGLAVRDGMLTTAHASAGRALARLVAQACGGAPIGETQEGGTIRISRPSGRRPYDLILTPMRREAVTLFGRSAAAMVLIGDSERTPVQIHELLVALYGLTPTEARVATLLLGGMRVEEIAERLQITGNTVRTHVKRALSKLDARTQSDLVRVLMSGPGQLR